MIEDRLLHAEEVAEMLDVPVSWVRVHTRNGDLPHIQLGRYRRYRRQDILAFVERELTGGDRPVRRGLRSAA